MINLLQDVLDWSEVWAPLIPITVLFVAGKQPRFLVPVIVYVWFALLIDACIDIGWKVPNAPVWMYPNNYLYNIHSIGRFLCFSVFFYWLHPMFRSRWDLVVFLLAIGAITLNFLFFEEFYQENTFSSRLFALEAGLLLFYCLRYFLRRATAPDVAAKTKKGYWVVVGLSIYVVFNFFYFLFYTTLLSVKEYENFVIMMWNSHNLTFIILCIFIARAFYVSGHQ